MSTTKCIHITQSKEAQQNHRKTKRVCKDRNHKLETSYLFNFLLDFFHNLNKYKKFMDTMRKDGKSVGDRDGDSWRTLNSNI